MRVSRAETRFAEVKGELAGRAVDPLVQLLAADASSRLSKRGGEPGLDEEGPSAAISRALDGDLEGAKVGIVMSERQEPSFRVLTNDGRGWEWSGSNPDLHGGKGMPAEKSGRGSEREGGPKLGG